MPEIPTIDVSECFHGIEGAVIKSFAFSHNEIRKGDASYGQPVTTIEMDSGKKVTFTINFGEVDENNRVAYYRIH